MPIKYENDTVYLSGVIGVEEAEDLYKIFIEHNISKVDASMCEHIHAAILQIMVGLRVQIVNYPVNIVLSQWLINTLKISN